MRPASLPRHPRLRLGSRLPKWDSRLRARALPPYCFSAIPVAYLFLVRPQILLTMDYPKEGSTSLYDYSDKSIPQAGYAAIVYAVISTLSTGLAWFRAPSTPWIAIVIVALVIGLFFGALAFGV